MISPDGVSTSAANPSDSTRRPRNRSRGFKVTHAARRRARSARRGHNRDRRRLSSCHSLILLSIGLHEHAILTDKTPRDDERFPSARGAKVILCDVFCLALLSHSLPSRLIKEN